MTRIEARLPPGLDFAQELLDMTTPTLDIPNLQTGVTLAPYTTYQIGGPADIFVEVTTVDELEHAVIAARESGMRFFLLGTGANILIADQGFRGLVIHNHADRVKVDGNRITAESGATMKELIAVAADAELSGFEHYAGIPSSVGGAIWQNLHFLAPDRQSTMFIESVVESAIVLMPDNERKEVTREFFDFGYDDSRLHHEEIVVLQVTFALESSTRDAILEQAHANLEWRAERQPPVEEFPSCGSVFKKIEGVGAGRLIDGAGLKGYQLGGIQVSPKHANFLVNIDGGSANDVLNLVAHIQDEVERTSGYQLEMEINTVGDFSDRDPGAE